MTKYDHQEIAHLFQQRKQTSSDKIQIISPQFNDRVEKTHFQMT